MRALQERESQCGCGLSQISKQNFTILSVSIDTEPANWLQAIRNDKLTWTHVIDVRTAESSVGLMYNVETIPQNFLIDPAGNIIAKIFAAPHWKANCSRC